ncbi:unnamed protein product [Pseudo-nitzschia multistriata]|uniref:Uncharacterized protein n=1 Tax=Pseudo-nitzschia multistriata TaxID=183589 RepID=A0A448ZG79_9STRA|nr:unnamed protein product [Pseudo-nitzschia multistriata]
MTMKLLAWLKPGGKADRGEKQGKVFRRIPPKRSSLSAIDLALAVAEHDEKNHDGDHGNSNSKHNENNNSSSSSSSSNSSNKGPSIRGEQAAPAVPSSTATSAASTPQRGLRRVSSARKLQIRWPPVSTNEKARATPTPKPCASQQSSLVPTLSSFLSKAGERDGIGESKDAGRDHETSSRDSTTAASSGSSSQGSGPASSRCLFDKSGADHRPIGSWQHQQNQNREQQQNHQQLPPWQRGSKTLVRETIDLYESINSLRRNSHKTAPPRGHHKTRSRDKERRVSYRIRFGIDRPGDPPHTGKTRGPLFSRRFPGTEAENTGGTHSGGGIRGYGRSDDWVGGTGPFTRRATGSGDSSGGRIGYGRPDVWITPLQGGGSGSPRTWIAKRVWNAPEKDDSEHEYEVDHSFLLDGVRDLLLSGEEEEGDLPLAVDRVVDVGGRWQHQHGNAGDPHEDAAGFSSLGDIDFDAPFFREATASGVEEEEEQEEEEDEDEDDDDDEENDSGEHTRGRHQHNLRGFGRPDTWVSRKASGTDEPPRSPWRSSRTSDTESDDDNDNDNDIEDEDDYNDSAERARDKAHHNLRGYGRPDAWVTPKTSGIDECPRSPWRSSRTSDTDSDNEDGDGEDENENESQNSRGEHTEGSKHRHNLRGFGRPDTWVTTKTNGTNESPRSPWRSSRTSDTDSDNEDENENESSNSRGEHTEGKHRHNLRGFGRPDTWVTAKTNGTNESPRSPWRSSRSSDTDSDGDDNDNDNGIDDHDDKTEDGSGEHTEGKNRHNLRGFGRPDTWVTAKTNGTNESPRSPWRSSRSSDTVSNGDDDDNDNDNDNGIDDHDDKTEDGSGEHTEGSKHRHNLRGFGRPDTWVTAKTNGTDESPRSPWRSAGTSGTEKDGIDNDAENESQNSSEEHTAGKHHHNLRGFGRPDTWVTTKGNEMDESPKSPLKSPRTSEDDSDENENNENSSVGSARDTPRHNQRGFGRPDTWVTAKNHGEDEPPRSPWRSPRDDESPPEDAPGGTGPTPSVPAAPAVAVAAAAADPRGGENGKESARGNEPGPRKTGSTTTSERIRKAKEAYEKDRASRITVRTYRFVYDSGEEDSVRGTPTWEKESLPVAEAPPEIKLWWQS